MPVLPDFRLETYFSKWEFAARYHMTASDAESTTLGELLALASDEDRAAFENLWLGYTETFGAPELREIIASTYEHQQAANVLCFAGAEEGIYCAMHALLESDDHAIVVTPNYQSAETVPLSICDVTGVALDIDNNWTLDIDKVEAAIQPNTKLVAINFPHNPTGKILERDRFDSLVELCRQRGLWLFSDEVFRLLGVTGAPQLPQAVDIYERGISLGVMSKAYGLPGLRIGWIACRDTNLLRRMERMKHYLSICNSAPSERLAIIALKNREKLLTRVHELMARNLPIVEQFFSDYEHLFDWRRPDGGCVAYPKYRGQEGIERFAAELVERTGVLFLPASIYRSELNPTPDGHFRLGYGRKHVEEGISVLRAYLERNAP